MQEIRTFIQIKDYYYLNSKNRQSILLSLPNHDSSSNVILTSFEASLSCAIINPDIPAPIPIDIIPVLATMATNN